MREGEVGIHPMLVEEGKFALRGKGEVWVRYSQLTGVENPEGVGGRVMNVEVT